MIPRFHGGTLTALKWLAVALMVADHVDWLLLDSALGLHSGVGRLVFPVFGFIVAYNASRPGAFVDGSQLRMVKRMLLVGALALPVYVPLAGWLPLNIMFTLALAVCVINILAEEGRHANRNALALALMGGLFVDYQWAGLAYIVAVWGAYARRWSPWWIVAAAASLVAVNGNFIALAALPLLWLASRLRLDMPRAQLAFYAVYPAHLAGLFIIGTAC